jgi:hypothetical protein
MQFVSRQAKQGPHPFQEDRRHKLGLAHSHRLRQRFDCSKVIGFELMLLSVVSATAASMMRSEGMW